DVQLHRRPARPPTPALRGPSPARPEGIPDNVGALNTVAFVHQRFALALILYAIILGVWGGFQFLRRRAVSAGFRSSYVLMIGLLAVPGVLGLVMFIAQ